MNEPGDLERRLEQWGSDEPSAVDGAFANRLDADLRQLASDRLPSTRQRPIWQPIVLTLAAALVVLVGVVTFTGDQGDQVALVMGPTTETEIEFPNGEIVTGEAGLALPDGTRITVGVDGSAVIADVVLDPGTEAIIQNGQLEILIDDRPAQTQPTSTVTATTSSARPTTAPPSTRPTTSSTRRPSSTTDSTTTGDSTTSTTARDSTTRPPTTDQVATTAPEAAVVLDWSERPGRILLTWTYTGPETLAGWEVTVTSGDRSRTLALLRDPTARSLTVELLDGTATYRVIAREAGGTGIAESNPITVP